MLFVLLFLMFQKAVGLYSLVILKDVVFGSHCFCSLKVRRNFLNFFISFVVKKTIILYDIASVQ